MVENKSLLALPVSREGMRVTPCTSCPLVQQVYVNALRFVRFSTVSSNLKQLFVFDKGQRSLSNRLLFIDDSIWLTEAIRNRHCGPELTGKTEEREDVGN